MRTGFSRIAARAGWLIVLGALLCAVAHGGGKERLPVGEFSAVKMKAPTLDGKIEPGEWDRTFFTSGVMTPFGHKLQTSATSFGLGYDEKNIYVLAICHRTTGEWYLKKSVRENDGYSYGDPSIEVWVSPPTMVPETYQSVINTYPAVMDVHNIPSRGYAAQGWRADWKIGVSENEERYIIEAAVPIKDFGFDTIKNGDVWQFLMCRTCHGAKPRAQASWSLTQGFSEIIQHVPVHFHADGVVVQVRGIETIHAGDYRFAIEVAAPEKDGANVDVGIVWHEKVDPQTGEGETKTVSLAKRERKEVVFEGKRQGKGNFTLSVTSKDGGLVYRQSFPYEVSGWKPSTPEEGAPPKELDIRVLYGPINNIMIVRADIINLPARAEVVGGTIRLRDPSKGDKVVAEHDLPGFKEWYSNANFDLEAVDVPVLDFSAAAAQFTPPETDDPKKIDAAKKKFWKELEQAKTKKLKVEVIAKNAAGEELKSASREVDLVRKKFPWQDNNVGITDEVIPPWTPLEVDGGTVKVWNKEFGVNGLGLVEKNRNGEVDRQIRSMKLVALVDGKRVEIKPSKAKVEKHVDAYARMSGGGEGAGLKLTNKAKVEFDGYVLNDLTIAPAGGEAKVEKLFLEVVLPESEATHYCTTAGGWAAAHAKTPEYWSSRMTGSGVLIGDFVPYVWLTNSDRAFLWLADNDKGWFTDDDRSLPTQEIERKDGTVTLRINFFEMPVTLKKPTSLRYAWQTFPSRPLPEGWRTIVCSNRPQLLPSAKNTYFWTEADWAVLWPYYCSPFAWSFEKSKKTFDRLPEGSKHRPCVGSIAHSIGRYMDYERREFERFVVDWGSTPGDRANANVVQCKGTVDFRVWHYREWVRQAGFRGLYVDENYLALEKNFIEGGAYYREDGQLQAGYSYLPLREYFKRFKVMMHQEGMTAPNLWQHISSGSAYHAWFGDIFFEGENVEPTNLEYDYIEVLPAERMRAIGSSACAGGVMTMMCQSQRHRTNWWQKHTHQFVGWVLAHDIMPEQVRWYEPIAQEAGFYKPGVRFLGYWKEENPAAVSEKDCMASTHLVGKRALVWVVNATREDKTLAVAVDWKKLGFDRAKCIALDVETGEEVALSAPGFALPVLQRDFKAVYIIERQKMEPGQTFLATFEDGVDADEAFGNEVIVTRYSKKGDNTKAQIDGRDGKALKLPDGGVELWLHQHVGATEGRIAFSAKVGGKDGGVCHIAVPRTRDPVLPKADGIVVALQKKQVVFGLADKNGRVDKDKRVAADRPGAGWHDFVLAWKDGKTWLEVDGKKMGEVPIQRMPVCDARGPALQESGMFVLGGSNAVEAVDTIRCFSKAE